MSGQRRVLLKNKRKIWCGLLLVVSGLLVLMYAVSAAVCLRGKYGLLGEPERAVGDTTEILYQGTAYPVRDDVVNILCLGVDREEDMMFDYGDGRSVGQADAIFLASIDLKTDEIRILAVPRDTMVSIRLYDEHSTLAGGFEGQIALQYAYSDGGDMSCYLMEHAVSTILGGIPIHGVVAINLGCIAAINDAVGGVEVTMEEDYTQINPAFAKGATVHLMGQDAVDFIQKRDTSVDGSALTRVSREKQYMNALIQQAKKAVRRNPGLPFDLIEELQGKMYMNLSSDEVWYLMLTVLGCDWSEEKMYVLPGEIRMGEVYEEYYLDEDAVTEIVVDLFCEK